MMVGKTSAFKKFFLLEFTKEIIRSTEIYRNFLIKNEVKKIISEVPSAPPENEKRKNQIRDFVRKQLHEESRRIEGMKKSEPLPEIDYFPQISESSLEKKIKIQRTPPLIIPEPNLPWTVKDIRPFPRQNQGELRLGRVDVLVKDPLVKTIECNGPDEKLIVTGAIGRKKTGIVLDEEEVDLVIERFSNVTKIPVSEGIFRVVYGKLSLSAVVSEVVGSKFIIKKMAMPPLQIPFER